MNRSSVDVLKQAYEEGFKAFFEVVQNDNGIYNNPHNPYPPKGLPHKEWERGMNSGYSQQRKVKHDGAI